MNSNKYVYVEGEGYVNVSFNRNGNPHKIVVLKTHLAKRFSGFNLIKKDIDLVIEALLTLKAGVDNSIVKQSLSFFSIVTYAKCFVATRGRGLFLQFNEVFKDVKEEHRENHERIINQRHDYVAHAGSTYEQCPISATLVVDTLFDDPHILNMRIGIGASMFYLYDIDSQIDGFLKLCDVLNEYLTNKLTQVHFALREETAQVGYLELAKRSFTPKIEDLETL